MVWGKRIHTWMLFKVLTGIDLVVLARVDLVVLPWVDFQVLALERLLLQLRVLRGLHDAGYALRTSSSTSRARSQ